MLLKHFVLVFQNLRLKILQINKLNLFFQILICLLVIKLCNNQIFKPCNSRAFYKPKNAKKTMNETQIIAKIQEIVGLQDQMASEDFKCFLPKTKESSEQLFKKLIFEIEPHLELKKFDNAVITNFKIMLLSLKFVNEKGGANNYSFFFQKVKTALKNGTN